MGELLEFPGRPSRRSDRGGEEGVGLRPPASFAASSEEAGPTADEPVAWAVPVVGPQEPSPGPPVEDRRTRRAANVAMATLARHDASEGEVRARLVAKGLDEVEVEAELGRLTSVGLIDDAAFAERLVASLRDRKGLGDGAIRSALRARLVPPSVVDAVLAEQVEDEEQLQERIRAVADDRARRLTTLPYEVAERRLTAYLLRKGYGGSAVRAAVRDALQGSGTR